MKEQNILIPPNPISSYSSNAKGNKGRIFAVLGILVLVIGTIAGAIIIGNPVKYFSRASTSRTVYQCQNIKAHKVTGEELSLSDLSKLKAGDTIHLVAHGTGISTNYKAVRFKVNGVVGAESTQKNIVGDYYTAYTIPVNTKTFSITAELKGQDDHWY